MELKKNPKYDLENYRMLFILTGLIIALGLSLYVLGLSKANVKVQDLSGNTNSDVEEEQVFNTRQDVPPPPPPKPQQQVAEILNIHENDQKIQQTFNFDVEADDETEVDFQEDDLGLEQNVEEDQEPLIIAEHMPEFPGGEVALRKYIAEHIKYPPLAQENGIQGTVFLRFVVKKDGTVGEVQVTRGVDPLLDEEAVRVVKSLPKFKPGFQGGKPVPVWFSVPIVFKLSE